MKSSRAESQRLIISSYISLRQSLDLPATFESLNDDTLTTVLEFVGDKSYKSFGGVNKRFKEVYQNTKGMTKETFLFGYGPLLVITNRIKSAGYQIDSKSHETVGKGVVFYNRRDIFEWALQEKENIVLSSICDVASKEGRTDILEEMWNKVTDGDRKRYIFNYVDVYAAQGGKMNVLKWIEDKGLPITNKDWCAGEAASHGHLHILKWLQEEQDLELFGTLYDFAIDGDQFHVLKWLREQACPWRDFTFKYAARKGNLNILQWLHDEGCPWPERTVYHIDEEDLKPEVVQWLRVNGYGDRIVSRR